VALRRFLLDSSRAINLLELLLNTIELLRASRQKTPTTARAPISRATPRSSR
jgi:hypothetical protein